MVSGFLLIFHEIADKFLQNNALWQTKVMSILS